MKQATTNRKTLLSTLLFLVLTTALSFGQATAEKIDDLLSLYHEYGQFNGSALVAHEGEIVYQKGHGLANMEWNIPNTPDTKHRLGSVTKQFTATLIIQLVEDGKLQLDVPITTYLPDYPKENGDQITVHHLLTHTSGILNYTNNLSLMQNEVRNPYTPEEFITFFADSTLDFEPGSQYRYSNSGYFVLGVIIEKITGQSYEEVLQENILKPLGMEDSGYDHHDHIIARRAAGYEKQGRDYVNASYIDMTIPFSAGSLYSTVEDLYLWDQALYTEKILSRESLDLMFTPHVEAGRGNSYGYGWGIRRVAVGSSEDELKMISHGGGIFGFNTIIARNPAENSLVILLNNTGGTVLNHMNAAIQGILHDKPYDLPKQSLANTVMDAIVKDGINAGVMLFEDLKENDKYNLSENEMNNAGYFLIRKERLEAAEAILKLNMDNFPESSNVYDSYAEVQLLQGNNDLAIEYYTKSVEINPGNRNAIDVLKGLGVEVASLTRKFSIADDVLESYVGQYELKPGFVLTISKESDQLKAEATGQPQVDIFPKAIDHFYLTAIPAELKFNRNEDDSIGSVTLFQGSNQIEGKRLVE